MDKELREFRLLACPAAGRRLTQFLAYKYTLLSKTMIYNPIPINADIFQILKAVTLPWDRPGLWSDHRELAIKIGNDVESQVSQNGREIYCVRRRRRWGGLVWHMMAIGKIYFAKKT